MLRSRRLFLPAFLTLALSAGFTFWWHFSQNNSPTANATPTANRISPNASPISSSPPTSAPITEPLPAFGSEAFNRLAKERSAAWMSARNRDAGSLLALWDLTGDEALLREAAERFPDNPQVSLAMLCLLEDKENSEAEKQQWTDQMIRNDPDNPLGYYFRAKLALGKNDKAGVVAALEAALGAKGKINHYARERMMTAKEGLLASGVSPKDTYQLSMVGTLARTSSSLVLPGQFNKFLRTELQDLKTAGQVEAHQETAALGLRLSEQIRITESPSLLGELMAASMRISFLKQLDSDTEIANTGRSVAEELVLAETAKGDLAETMKQSSVAHAWLMFAPLEVQAQYADRKMMDGEMAAVKYLLNQVPKP